MTPELRQAIQLLQYTSQELNEYLEKQIEENPMLDVSNLGEEYENIDDKVKEREEIDWKEYIGKYDDSSYKGQIDKNIEQPNYENFISYSPSLRENLLFQLNVSKIDERFIKIGKVLIENIDENGYLATTLEQIAEDLGANIKDVENVLLLIQSFEPIGVGARDLKECLLIQIKEYKPNNPPM